MNNRLCRSFFFIPLYNRSEKKIVQEEGNQQTKTLLKATQIEKSIGTLTKTNKEFTNQNNQAHMKKGIGKD